MFWAVYFAGIVGLASIGLTTQSLLGEVRALTDYLSESARKDYISVFEDRYRIESNLGQSAQARNSILNESIYARNWTASGVNPTPNASWVQLSGTTISGADRSIDVNLMREGARADSLDFGVVRQELRGRALVQLKSTYFKFKRIYGEFDSFPSSSSSRQLGSMLDIPAPSSAVSRCSGVANISNMPLGCEDIYSAAGTPVMYRHNRSSNEIEFFFVAPWLDSAGALERVSYKIQYDES